MFRLWGKIWKDNHLLKDTVICDDSEDTRTHKIFRGLESICYEMDLGNPIWLESTVRHFKKHGKARFYQVINFFGLSNKPSSRSISASRKLVSSSLIR